MGGELILHGGVDPFLPFGAVITVRRYLSPTKLTVTSLLAARPEQLVF